MIPSGIIDCGEGVRSSISPSGITSISLAVCSVTALAFSPSLLSCEPGQKVNVQVFYRNSLTKPISATVPNFCGYEVAVHDTSGTKLEVFDLQEPIVVGGARSEQIGNEPISSHGRSLAFAPSSLAKDKREEYRSKTGASILIFVEPGKSYRMQFSVSNHPEGAERSLNTGEVEIAVGQEVGD